MNSTKANEFKEKGNKCLNDGNYAEALLHYTDGIRMDGNVYQLYSNRSLAFLKLQQYYYANEDAKQVILMRPNWYKGFYRRAEVELEAGQYEMALKSYHLTLQLLDDDSDAHKKYSQAIDASIKKTLANLQKQHTHDYQIPWIGAALGLVVGMAVIACDYVSNATNPLISHPILKLFVVAVFAALFFYLAKLQRKYTKSYRESLLKPPLDLFDN